MHIYIYIYIYILLWTVFGDIGSPHSRIHAHGPLVVRKCECACCAGGWELREGPVPGQGLFDYLYQT